MLPLTSTMQGTHTSCNARGRVHVPSDAVASCTKACSLSITLPQHRRVAACPLQRLVPEVRLAASSRPPTRRALVTCAAKGGKGSQGSGGAGRAPAKEPRTDPRDDKRSGSPPAPHDESSDGLVEDGFLDDLELLAEEYEEGEEEGGEGDEGEDEDDEGEGDDYAASFLEPDDAPREVQTGDTAWGEVVLRAAREVLAQPALKGLDLYLFRAIPATRKVDIRLDKLEDLYGSPSIDDIERFQRGLFAVALDRELGPEAAGDISFEVSSPGAERIVRVPDELTRFAEVPLKVVYLAADGKETTSVLLLVALDEEAGTSVWRLANVRANAPVKGRALTKKQLSQQVEIRLSNLVRVRIHVNF